MANEFSFITRMPDSPGTLEKAAWIIKKHSGNIERIHYDREIDSNTVFFEIKSSPEKYLKIMEALEEIGYLQTGIEPVSVLKFNVLLPNRPGALFDFLRHLTDYNANIAYLDFDEMGLHPDRLTVTLTVENGWAKTRFLDELKSEYSLEILEYDGVGTRLDDAVFYIRFAQQIRGIVGDCDEQFLLNLLKDSNHVAQEIASIGKDPKQVFESIIATGNRLRSTQGQNFYADIQRFSLNPKLNLLCFQMPCGGNIYLFETPDEIVMVDSGYGIYYRDFLLMLQAYGFADMRKLKHIYITHADADHVGSAGLFDALVHMHSISKNIMDESNRAYGSNPKSKILPQVYTKLINLFSEFSFPSRVRVFNSDAVRTEGIFSVISSFEVGGVHFDVLEGLGGHLAGQVFFLSRDPGLIFTADSLINFESISGPRKEFNLLAKNLMTSVNIDSQNAHREREGLMELIRTLPEGTLVCCGHGAVSVLRDDKLEVAGKVENYQAGL